jgi:glycine/D-amino acid oxidase-like deaminating enzyme
LPHVHEPETGLLVAIGCQGRGIGWQTAIGIELAKRVLDRGHAMPLPFAPVQPIPLHAFKAMGTSAMIAMYRALDALRLS